ncbi:MAG: D-amino-acid transaminase [Pseudomonadota bacterium]
MPRDAYVNGRFIPHRDGAVHIEDRGYQFADGVYEVIPIVNGVLVDDIGHLDRLDRSLAELQIAAPMSRRALQMVINELIERNGVSYGSVYFQVTRGVAPRDHKFPEAAKPALVITTKKTKPHSDAVLTKGVSVITIADQRWARCDIKSVSLLPNILGKQRAAEEGAYEALQVDQEGYVTEGTSSNAWIVTKDDKVVTRKATNAILNGITRSRLIELITAEGLTLEERAFTVAEAKEAREAFVTSSSSLVMPVTEIDHQPVGNGHPGLLTGRLRATFLEYVDGLRAPQ